MEMPKPTKHHEKLATMVGEWTGEETMSPSPWDPKGGTATSRTSTRLELGGFFLLTDYVQERDGRVSYRGHGVVGWDAGQERFTLYWFNSMGIDPGAAALGTWEGDVLRFQHQHDMGHSRYTYTFDGPDSYTFTLEHSLDGQEWMTFLQGTYKRVS